MPILNNIAYGMRKFPKIKSQIKKTYQHIGNILSDKKTEPSDIIQISDDSHEHMFGYYDKCPWNKQEDKIIFMQISNADRNPDSDESVDIILKDLTNNQEEIIGTTSSWNVQQGCMLQWIGPDFNSKVIYNDFIDNDFKSVILDINTKEKKIIDAPIYDIDKKGEYAFTLDFCKLHDLRPGYGYKNKKSSNKEIDLEDFCIWKIDLKENKKLGIIKYKDLYNMDFKDTMEGAEHKVNHIMINPFAKRFMFLHRWIKNGVKYTRLITSDYDGQNLYNLLDDGMISHSTWKDENTILTWARKEEIGNRYFLLKDKTQEYEIVADEKLVVDGHPSYRHQGDLFVTDTYPDFKRKQHIYLYNQKEDKLIEIASVFANIKYNEDCRCDLHPRWNYSGNKICFDGAQKEKRQVYIIDVEV